MLTYCFIKSVLNEYYDYVDLLCLAAMPLFILLDIVCLIFQPILFIVIRKAVKEGEK